MSTSAQERHKSVAVDVGGVIVGGGHPIVVQSMTNTDTADVEATARQVAALARAGIVTKLAARAKGFAPTSNGHVRYAIIRDLGPIAPSAGALFVTDHNARARIDYKTEEH